MLLFETFCLKKVVNECSIFAIFFLHFRLQSLFCEFVLVVSFYEFQLFSLTTGDFMANLG